MKPDKKYRLVILDDDPTGIQTVHGCLLITQWDEATVRMALQHEQPFFYMLTNTRAMTREEAARVVRSAMETVLEVNREFGYRLIFISRSDSCLRGHFPLETDVMRRVLQEYGVKVWPKVPFCPALIEAGRVTIDGVHYMKDGERLIPVSETEFARDNVFAYHTSVLADYIREKGANPEEYQIVNAATYDERYVNGAANGLYHLRSNRNRCAAARFEIDEPFARQATGYGSADDGFQVRLRQGKRLCYALYAADLAAVQEDVTHRNGLYMGGSNGSCSGYLLSDEVFGIA